MLNIPIKFATGWKIKDGVTQSMLSDFAACRQRLKFQLDGWEPKIQKKALVRGSVVHDSLFDFYQGLAIDKPLERKTFLQRVTDLDDDDLRCRLTPLLYHYYDFARCDQVAIKWHKLERVFSTRYREFRLRGKWDGEFYDPSGRPWILETKTMSRIVEEQLLDQLLVNEQLSFYHLAREALYKEPPIGILYNILRYPGQRLKVAEPLDEFQQRIHEDIEKRPEHYFKRITVTFDTEQIENYKEDLRRKLVTLRRWSQGKEHTYKNTQACFGAWTCDYVDACVRCSMAAYTQTRKPFQELEEADASQ